MARRGTHHQGLKGRCKKRLSRYWEGGKGWRRGLGWEGEEKGRAEEVLKGCNGGRGKDKGPPGA
jgi:hypothetical protein